MQARNHGYIMKQTADTKAAIRALCLMPANTAILIRPKIEAYAQDPTKAAKAGKSSCQDLALSGPGSGR